MAHWGLQIQTLFIAIFFSIWYPVKKRHFTLEPCYYNKIPPVYLTREIQGRNIDLTQTAERQATFLKR